MTTRDAAQEIGVSRRTLQRHIKSGKLKTTQRRGKCALISRADLARYVRDGAARGQSLRARADSVDDRVSALEQRVQTLEALLDITPTRRVVLSDEDVVTYRERLHSILHTRKRWMISDISALINDVARLSPETVSAVSAKLLHAAMERCIVEARLLRHSRSEIYAGRAILIMRELGVSPGEVEHLASDW